MQKISFLFLLLILGIALIGVYQSMFPVPTVTAYDRFFALSSFFLLCISLIIGPLVTIWPKEYAQLIEPRRAVGITTFIFIVLHFFLAMTSVFNWQLNVILASVPSLVAVLATVILLILTLTSSDFAVKVLGPVWWKRIQQFNYLAFILSFVHFVLRANGLFTPIGTKVFVNLSEVALVLLGVATVGLQIAGFVTRKNREKILKEKSAQTLSTDHGGG
ncbi:Sulfoxide reductase heme-binding subunit YedZ [Candidatus Bilamarchaeum dharawalense]|uniref:Sulfoxide reductase heme-binding subunit YedZ n=1 Tax=Candidatus Bilamarchaeum dharawalense TaxID=2885759 RepID=A0A5E4LSG3_9ARCH|nr:Sulfoxide reductase heme-binding subunit YedZ [Candidatus Bilamarchaeum dharawalense]